jgi:pimeloyl-ACP methyl ester carboxylesterase
MTILLVVCAVLFLLIAHNFIVARLFHIELEPDEIHYVLTEDRWRLAISRYRGAPGGCAEPVILCHGLGANRYNMDFGGDYSLAKYLHGHGFDVWVAELRGTGLSSHPRLFSRQQYGFSFDDFAWRDAPAIVAAVREKTGAPRVFWVGHSMGGLLAYVFLQGPLSESLKGVVAISSPGRFVRTAVYALFRQWARIASLWTAIHLEAIGRFFAPYITLLPEFILRTTINPSNMEPSVIRRACANLAANISRGVFMQFSDWMERGDIFDQSLRRNYTEGLKGVTTPMYLIAGGGDALVPPDSVELVYRLLPEGDKTFKRFSLADGARADYGHGDIILGVTAREEVWPTIAEWLEKRATRKT